MKGARAKKRNFLVKIVLKVFKNGFFDLFFQKLPEGKFFGKNKVFIEFWECSENQFGQPKKVRQNFQNFFENTPPPLAIHVGNQPF